MNFKVKKISDQDKGKVYIMSDRIYVDKRILELLQVDKPSIDKIVL